MPVRSPQEWGTHVIGPLWVGDGADIPGHGSAPAVNPSLVVHVGARGAVGDGVTDDTDAIAAAIVAAAAIGARVEFDPDGTYLVSTLNVTSSGVIIEGNGATLKQKAATAQRIRFGVAGGTLVDDITIRNLTIDGSAVTGGFGLQVNVTSRCLVENVRVIGAPTIAGYQGIGINGDGSTRGSFVVRGCRVSHTGEHGIIINTTVVGAVVEACTVEESCESGATGAAIYARGLETRVAHCTVRTAYDNGIRMSGAGSVAIGNYVELANVDGIRLEGARQAAIGNTVTTKLDDGGAGNGIRVSDTSGARVIGNYVTGCSNGIQVDDAGTPPTDCILEGNECVANTNGINVEGSRHVIANNLCKNNAGPGIQGVNATYVTCQGNNCYDDQTPKTQTYGIRTSGTSDFWSVTGNIALGPDHLTGGISLSGTGNNAML